MCGIVGIHFKNPRDLGVGRENLESFVDELLLGIEHRGRDATGLLTVDAGGKANLIKADVNASTFIRWRDNVPKRVRTILGHTRFATQGGPENLDNNHPVQFGSCFVIHNGHISNDTELFKEHDLKRNAEVDSEIIPALLDKYGLDNAVTALEELDGNFAVAAVDPVRFPNTTVLAKGWSSPVEVYENHYSIVWASTAEAIKTAVRIVFGFNLPDRKIESLALGEMLVMEGDTVERVKFSPLSKSWSSRSSRGVTYTYSGSWGVDDDDDTELSGTVATYTEVSEFMSEECANCGCERLYHGSGSNFNGACQFLQANDFSCRCLGFKIAPPVAREASVLAMEFCDGCGREFWMGELVKIGRNYLCPNLCAKDPALRGTVEVVTSLPAADLRKRAEDVLARELAAGDTEENASDAREEAINEHVCQMASVKTGQEPAYIDWLVNDMKSDIAESDSTGYLVEAQRIAGKAYFDAWALLDDELNDLDQHRFTERLGEFSEGASRIANALSCDLPECGVDNICEHCERVSRQCSASMLLVSIEEEELVG